MLSPQLSPVARKALARDARLAARHYNAPYPLVRKRLLRLFGEQGVSPREALMCGLLHPAVQDGTLAGAIGKEKLCALQGLLNPREHECLTEDKRVFQAYCESVGLPVPRLFAVFEPEGGWVTGGQRLVNDRDWESFLREEIPEEFIVKPTYGVYGEGFQMYRRQGDGFVDAAGQMHSATQVLDLMRRNLTYRSWLIQERLTSHPELVRLSGTSFLQTLRIMTMVGDDGQTRAFAPLLKVIVGANIVDNFCAGSTGNLLAKLGRADGRLGPGVLFAPHGLGMDYVYTHPTTQIDLAGFLVPDVEPACRLAESAASFFRPLRTIGWDVALTPKGPVLVEGNVWWDPKNELLAGPTVSGEDRDGMAVLLAGIHLAVSRSQIGAVGRQT